MKGAIVKTMLFWMVLIPLIALGGCDYARMYDQESVRTYKKEMPVMDERTIPVQDGFQLLVTADPKTLRNPVPPSAQSKNDGRQAYGYFCIQCHGPNGDGLGTVGQSFSPLPSDLATTAVQSLSDGELYARIRLGYRRHPRLFTTISEADTWAIVDYMRSLKASR
ncbi:MAG: cytochrome c [Syntrophorhabdales bacterium]|jgi:mono/diheme cytochrome c family protein